MERKDLPKVGIIGDANGYNYSFICNYLGLKSEEWVGTCDYEFYSVNTDEVGDDVWLLTEHQALDLGYKLFFNTDELLAFLVENGYDDKRTIEVNRKRVLDLLRKEALLDEILAHKYIEECDIDSARENAKNVSLEDL